MLRGIFRGIWRKPLAAPLGLLLCLAIWGCAPKPEAEDPGAFLARHWQDPLPPQGAPPAEFSDLEASLAPQACGQCHQDQYQQWQTALHSHTMGPGLLWQVEILGPEQSNDCLRCHAPLAEQKALLARDMGWPNTPTTEPPPYVPTDLHLQGLGCASCHVRGHAHFGPPAKKPVVKDMPHGGFTAAAAFQDSRFCATCHQFPEDGPRLAGKLREDTYAQWLASPYAGKQNCQSCHMPEGRHLWRGIHDPDMVRQALALELKLEALGDDEYRAVLVARNQGAGHHLPTYMVAKIDLVLELHQPGRPVQEVGRDVIGWTADVEMTREVADTRIPAGGSHTYSQVFRAPKGMDWSVEARADVRPREHYERMFQYNRQALQLSPRALKLLEQTIAESAATHFTALRIAARP